MPRTLTVLISVTVALSAGVLAPGAAVAAPACKAPDLLVATGCVTRAAAVRHVTGLTREVMRENRLKAAIVRIDTGRRTLLAQGFGASMPGVPASTDMRFRIGSMAIPHLITVLLQLQDEKKLKLDDRLSRFLPDLPNADRITLRMLASSTSGYRDWIQGNREFVDALFADPFRLWTPDQLLTIAFAQGSACEPGTCFHYAHTNFAVLSKVIAQVTGRSVTRLIRDRVLTPLGLRQTAISRNPGMPGPVLHAYTSMRGPYEDATFWSPSWTIGAGTVMSATIGDVARTARAVGTGALLSRAASRERVAPVTAGLSPFSPSLYFGLGIIVSHGWYVQNPMLNGYTGAMGYFPGRDLSVAIVATTRRGADEEIAYASRLFTRLTAYLAPGHTADLPG